MTAAQRGCLILSASLALLVVVLDQLSKWVILEVVMQPPRTLEITSFFNIVLTYNTGVSFGMLSGTAEWRPYFLSFLALAVSAGLLVWVWRQPEKLLAFAVGLIVGGALGNVVDRLFAEGHAVVDFLDFHYAGWHWPAFNLADSAITVGVGLVLLDGLFLSRERANKAES